MHLNTKISFLVQILSIMCWHNTNTILCNRSMNLNDLLDLVCLFTEAVVGLIFGITIERNPNSKLLSSNNDCFKSTIIKLSVSKHIMHMLFFKTVTCVDSILNTGKLILTIPQSLVKLTAILSNWSI